MKQMLQFLLTLTLCGCAFTISGATIPSAAPVPAAPTTIPAAHSITAIPMRSLPILAGPSYPLQGTPSDHSPISSSQRPLFDPSNLLEEIVGIPPTDPFAVPIEDGEAYFVSVGRLANGTILLNNVPLVNQQNHTSCGEAAFAMGWNYRHPERVLDIGTVETTGLNLDVYFPADLPGANGYLGTSPVGMEAIGAFYADHYGQLPPTTGNINLDNGEGYAQLEARGLLYSQLSAGNPVIIEVTDIIGSPSKTYNDSHYVIVTGMNFDGGRVTYNDSYINLSMDGRVSGYNRSVEWSELWISWSGNKDINPGEAGHPGRGWYMVVH